MPYGLDPIYLLALPLFAAHGYAKRQQLRAARARAMRRHPSAR